MALAKRNEGSKVSSEINVTPMVDVMLVLLIIFMVVTPMLQKGISVDMAKVNNPAPMQDADREDALLVSITRDGNVYFGSEKISVDGLTTKGLDALVPQPPPPNAPKNNTPDRTIVVQLIDRGAGQDPGVKINNEEATWDNLQGRLTDIYKARAEKVMFVKGDDAIPFANVANVIDIAHAAGVDKVGLITAKIEAGG